MESSMSSWAQLLRSPDEIPQYFVEAFTQNNGTDEIFPYTIYAPQDKWGNRKTNPKLFTISKSKVCITEYTRNGITNVCFSPDKINYIEKGTMLLHSWIKISWTVDNIETVSIIEFNSVVEKIFIKAVEILRGTAEKIELSDTDAEPHDFNYLLHINYKFMNYSKDSILKDEKVIASVFQPDIFKIHHKFFKKLICTSHILILTNKEIIIINEDKLKSTKEARFGGVWIYIPLRKVEQVLLDSDLDETVDTISVYLSDGIKLESIFNHGLQNELHSLLDKYKLIKDV